MSEFENMLPRAEHTSTMNAVYPQNFLIVERIFIRADLQTPVRMKGIRQDDKSGVRKPGFYNDTTGFIHDDPDSFSSP